MGGDDDVGFTMDGKDEPVLGTGATDGPLEPRPVLPLGFCLSHFFL